MRPSGRPPAAFAVAAAAARPPPGALHHRKAAAAARSRAALALVLLVSAAAFFFVVAARGNGGGGGIDVDATPFPSSAASSSSSSSRPSSVRTSVGTRSVSASGAEEKKSDKAAAETATEGAEDGGASSSTSKKSSAPPPPPSDPVSVFFARPVRELRHDGSAFTQGLEFDRICSGPHALPPEAAKGGGGGCRDVFWESTGLNGRSTVRLVDLESGKPLRTAKLPDDAFGEGLTKVPSFSGGGKGGGGGGERNTSGSSSRLLQLTWLSGRAFWHDADALLNSSDSNIGPKNPVEALGGAIDDALNRRAGGGGANSKKGSSSDKPVSEETRTPLGDGWGAAFVPAASAVALSDGSSRITFADARDVSRALRTITVTDEDGGEEGSSGSENDGKKKRVEVFNLNELEWVPAGAVRSLLSSSSSSSSSAAAAAALASNDTAEAKAAQSSLPFGLGGGDGGGKKSKGTGSGGNGIGNASLADGELWANVWGTPCVARVDPLSGAVVGWVLAPDLRPRALAAAASASAPFSSSSPQGQIDVLNGIAVDDGSREASTPPLSRRARLFMTGKNWPLLFEVRLERAGGGKDKEGSSSSSSEPSSSSQQQQQQQQAALTAARGSCIRPVADFG